MRKPKGSALDTGQIERMINKYFAFWLHLCRTRYLPLPKEDAA